MDQLAAMRAFVAVVDARGFTPAGRRLGISPSVVTRLVARLEEHLGTRLLQRTTRSVALTDAGGRYLERARRILAEVEDADQAALAERARPTGCLVVAAPVLFGRMHVAPLMSRYLDAYPEASATFLLSDRVENLVEDGIDLAVRIGHLEDSSLIARKVGQTRRVLVAAPAYLELSGEPDVPSDLASHRTIQFLPLAPPAGWTFAEDGREIRATPWSHFVTNSADAALSRAQQGGGLTLALSYQVADAVQAARLRIVLARFEPPPLPIHIVYPTSRLLSAKVRTFIDLVTGMADWHFG
jgi:DNA-binding transcriptional LysR family regulator